MQAWIHVPGVNVPRSGAAHRNGVAIYSLWNDSSSNRCQSWRLSSSLIPICVPIGIMLMMESTSPGLESGSVLSIIIGAVA